MKRKSLHKSPAGTSLHGAPIHISVPQQLTKTFSFVSAAVFFLMFFFASMGFFLSVQTVFTDQIFWKPLCVWLLAGCLLSCILMFAGTGMVRFLLSLAFYGLLLCFFLLYYRSAFLLSASSCAEYLVLTANQIYVLGQPVPEGMEAGLCAPFLFFVLLVFQYLLLIAGAAKKRWVYSLLLCLPLVFSVSFDCPPSYTALGFLLAAFLLWDCKNAARLSQGKRLLSVLLVLVLYLLCIRVLVPGVSSGLFTVNPALHRTVRSIGSSLQASLGFDTKKDTASGISSSADEPSDPILPSLPWAYGAFTYETASDSQTLDNHAPSYTGQNMFTLDMDRELTRSLYLRGFIGDTYSEARWSKVPDSPWTSEDGNLSASSLWSFYNLPYYLGQPEEPAADLKLYYQFHSAYSYFPYGACLPSSIQLTESNQVSGLGTSSFSWVPLYLDTCGYLFSSDSTLSSLGLRTAADTYTEYVWDRYLLWEEEGLGELYQAVTSMPSYPLSRQSSLEEIQEGIREIQDYLWDHASYSLSLEDTGSTGNRFLQAFLYERHTGFCIHFATAGTLMCRMMGIPARYVTGYTVHPEDGRETSFGIWRYTVPDSNAHAWTEVYLGKGGWVPVEMTPSSDTASSLPEEDHTQAEQEQPAPQTDSPDASTAQTGGIGPGSPSGISVRLQKALLHTFAVLICTAVLLLLLLTVRALRFRRHMGYFASSRQSCYLTVFQSLLKLWQIRYHLPRGKGSFDSAFFLEISKKIPPGTQEILHLLHAQAEEFTFSSRMPDAKDIRSIRQIYLQERKQFLASLSLPKKAAVFFLKGI